MNWEDRICRLGEAIYDYAVLEWIGAVAVVPAAYLLIVNLSR